MSRLCRLRTETHGEDGQWAYDEITKLREQVAAQAAVIEKFKRAIGAWDRAETPSELQSAEAGLLKSLAIPTDSTQILEQYIKEKTQAQAAVIENLRDALAYCASDLRPEMQSRQVVATNALAIPTDSTQILDKLRRAERERCAKVVEEGTALTAFQSKDCYSYAYNRAEAIRAME